MKVGVIGPASGHDAASVTAMRSALEFLVAEAEVESVVYLGHDPLPERVIALSLSRQHALAEAAGNTDPRISHAAIATTDWMDVAQRLHRVSEAPIRTIELLGDRVVVFVEEKAALGEEEIANSHVMVWANAEAATCRKFGPRCFFSPGPLAANRVGVISMNASQTIEIDVYETSGMPVFRETLEPRISRVQINK